VLVENNVVEQWNSYLQCMSYLIQAEKYSHIHCYNEYNDSCTLLVTILMFETIVIAVLKVFKNVKNIWIL